MSRFNRLNTGNKTTNLAGGNAYKQTPELEFLSIILTSMLKDKFYETSAQELKRIEDLVSKIDPEFAAKACIFARDVFGLRSITHVVASLVAKKASGSTWAKDFYYKVVVRPDDMTEIISHYKTHSKSLPNAMKKGFAKYLSTIDTYKAAKYKAKNKKVSLVDVVNLTHPKAKNEQAATALKSLVEDKFEEKQNTWEARLSETKGDKEAKKEVWQDLVLSKKLGYFALLRNLNNILDQSSEVVDAACEMLTDDNLIKKSRVMPFRFLTAYKAVEDNSKDKDLFSKRDRVLQAISDALDKSVVNVPKFEGKNLILLDASGSMFPWLSPHKFTADSVFTKAAILASAIAKANPSSVIVLYSDDLKILRLTSRNISILDLVKGMYSEAQKSGTDLGKVFDYLVSSNTTPDRIFILSDMQSWMSSTRDKFNNFCRVLNTSPRVYSLNINGSATLEFPQKNVVALAGYSDKLLDLFKYTEMDYNAMYNYVNSHIKFES